MKLKGTIKSVLPSATNDDTSWGNESYPAAVLVCAIGFFMHIILSAPLLNILGIDYGSDDASTFGKIHPGSYLIVISFIMFLFSRHNPLEQTIRIGRQETAFFSLFVMYVVIIIYWVLRGPKGVGLILDIHIVMPICAIVFSYAPRHWYRPIVYLFAFFAVLNALIGVGESLTHMRVFPFDPSWEVLQQDYFRASALMGHPLTNAAFNGASMFVILSLRMPTFLKGTLLLIMLAALVAFGGRSALIFSISGLVILGLIQSWKYFTSNDLTVLRMITALMALLLIPAFCFGILYSAMHSEMGERLMAYHSLEDDSANVRADSLRVLNYVTPTQLIFGVDGDEVADLGAHMGVGAPTTDIENPWVLMLLLLGGMMFTIWLCALLACLWRLLKDTSPALKMAVISYFCMASTANSFGRKDPIYMLIIGITVCAKRLNQLEKI